MKKPEIPVRVRQTKVEDIPEIQDICRQVYTTVAPWNERQITSHIGYFPEGQLVAYREDTGELLGMAASFIVDWSEYDINDNYSEFVGDGTFNNHDPGGRTLYGAEIMVRPNCQGMGVGNAIYAARKELVQRLGLLRIRAGARLRGYCQYAPKMAADVYVEKILRGDIWDPTISFQMKHGFRPLKLVANYFLKDPECLGYALVIEWLNPEVATEKEYEKQKRTASKYLGDHHHEQ